MLAAAMLAPAPAGARSARVTGPAELSSAPRAAGPGDAIRLAAGAYGQVAIVGGGSAADLRRGEPGTAISGSNLCGQRSYIGVNVPRTIGVQFGQKF